MSGMDQPQFEYGAILHKDFNSLLHNSPGSPLSSGELVALAFRRGRVLMQAPAGAGKSTFLRRIAEESDGKTYQCSVLRAADMPRSAQLEVGIDDAEVWLRGEFSDDTRPVLLIVDGLDELPAEAAQQLLAGAEQLTQADSGCAVLVSDRPGRRMLNENRWALIGLSHVPPDAVDDVMKTSDAALEHEWLGLPLYLELAASGMREHSKVAVFARYVSLALSSDKEATNALAQAAYDWWRTNYSSIIDEGWLVHRLGQDLLDQALQSQPPLLTRVGKGYIQFFHSLLHGYLAARATRDRVDNWSREAFEVLTLRGATFEPLGMLLAQVDDASVDVLIRAVDDWNFYAASYLLGEDRNGSRRVSQDLSAALLVMLAIRRFGPVSSTVLQVEDALRMHGGQLADNLLSASDLASVVASAETLAINSIWWSNWLRLLARQVGSTVETEDIQAVGSPDSFIGWMSANVLVTRFLSPDQWNLVRDLAIGQTGESVRWRYIHLLSGASDSDSLQTCLQAFRNDASQWVRYGALRSYISIAAKLPALSDRTEAFAQLAENADTIARNRKWSREIERASDLANQPDGWSNSVGLLIEELWARSNSVEQQDRWRRLSVRLRAHRQAETDEQ